VAVDEPVAGILVAGDHVEVLAVEKLVVRVGL
jgi:hypothetical protein